MQLGVLLASSCVGLGCCEAQLLTGVCWNILQVWLRSLNSVCQFCSLAVVRLIDSLQAEFSLFTRTVMTAAVTRTLRKIKDLFKFVQVIKQECYEKIHSEYQSKCSVAVSPWCNTLLKMQTGLLKYSQRKLTPCQLNNLFYFAGAILCAMYKAQRNEVTGVVWWRPLPAPGGLPWPAGEREGTQGGLCLQAALCSLPAEVRQRDYGLVKWSLQQRSVTPWVKCVKKFKKK